MTRMLMSFPAIDAGAGVLLASWWDEINESVAWQDGIFYSLCAAYALVSAVALIQLIRIELRVPEYGWTTQKVFHLMNFIVNGVRAIVFGFHTNVFLLHPKALSLVLLESPGLFFFSTYTLLVLFWAEIYNQARCLPTDKLRIWYFAINSGVYFVQAGIWVYLWIDDNSTAEFVGKIFVAVVSFAAALGFLLYGGRLFIMLRRFPIESKGRRKKLYEVGSVTAICFTCFLIRCFVVMLSAFDLDASLDVLEHPVLNAIYYTLVEILPSALVLYILRKLPPKRVPSAQYHPVMDPRNETCGVGHNEEYHGSVSSMTRNETRGVGHNEEYHGSVSSMTRNETRGVGHNEEYHGSVSSMTLSYSSLPPSSSSSSLM